MGMASAASSIIDPAVHSSVPEEFMLIEYSRSDAEFETCLATEPSLRACLDKLHRAGHSVFREATDPKLYVEPDFVKPIIVKLTKEGVLLNGVRVLWQGLKCRHVIVSEAYYPVVQSAIANLRKKCKVRVKCEARIDLSNDDVSDETAASGSMHPQQHPVPIAPLCLRGGENGFEDKGQRHIESFEAALTGELLDDIFREQESESDEVVKELSRLITSLDSLGEHCSSFCMAEIQTPEFHDGRAWHCWLRQRINDIWMEMNFL